MSTANRPSRFNLDSGSPAPRTGQVIPVDPDKTKWCCRCYKCGHDSLGTSRKVVIDRHKEHYQEEH